MCNSKCGGCKGCCTPALIGKILLIVGGIHLGLIGVGMLMGNDLNLVKLLLGAESNLEAIVYILVGIAAVMKIFGCKCKKCTDGTCAHDSGSMNKSM